MGSRRLDSIADYDRAKLNLRVECRCGRVAVLSSAELTAQCHRRKTSRQMDQVVGRLRCADCGLPPKDWGPIEARK